TAAPSRRARRSDAAVSSRSTCPLWSREPGPGDRSRGLQEQPMEIKGIDQLLGQLRAAAAAAKGAAAPPAAAAAPGTAPRKADFSEVLKASLDQVSAAQQQATGLARDFELGTTSASLPEVMISLQKANISFQQVVQVRNKLVSAYHDIMNMQV